MVDALLLFPLSLSTQIHDLRSADAQCKIPSLLCFK